MRVHFQRDLDRLNERLLTLSSEVESDVRSAVCAFEERKESIARQVVEHAVRIHGLEVEVEDDCLKILALHQPVAADLRYVIVALKINQSLKRIGNQAVHIAKRGLFLCGQPSLNIPFRLGEMADKAQAMLKKVLDAFVNGNSTAAREVCVEDGEIDTIHREILEQGKASIRQNPSLLEPLLQIMHTSRHLERIADQATNIAEDLIFLIEGRIVRHTKEVSDETGRS